MIMSHLNLMVDTSFEAKLPKVLANIIWTYIPEYHWFITQEALTDIIALQRKVRPSKENLIPYLNTFLSDGCLDLFDRVMKRYPHTKSSGLLHWAVIKGALHVTNHFKGDPSISGYHLDNGAIDAMKYRHPEVLAALVTQSMPSDHTIDSILYF